MRARWAGPFSIAAVGLAMAAWTWRQWPDVVFDFGRELYVPWQLAQGKVLYRDLASFNGPLSPYVNSVWFRLFGVSLLTLALANIALLVALVSLLYSLLCRIGSRLGATIACVTLLALFAFGQYVIAGNYNFVCPYSHEMTHGVLLCTAGLFCVARYGETGRLAYAAGAGLAVGLVFLTKVEMFAAGAASTSAGLAMMLWVRERANPRALRAAAAFLGAAIVPPLVALALFSTAMPVERVLRETLGYWTAAFRPDLRSLPFFRQGMGTDDVGGNLWAMAGWAGAWALLLAPFAAAGLIARRPGRVRGILTGASFVAAAAALAARSQAIAWREAARPFPLFLVVICALTVWKLAKRREDPDERSLLALRAALVLLALVLLVKMVLNTRIYHYGFVLALPAALLLVVALLDWVPAWIDGRGGHGAIFRAAVLAAWAVAVLVHLGMVRDSYRTKRVLVGSGADAFWADGRGVAFNEALEDIRSRIPPGGTLTAVPEGAMLNYLARRAASTPYTFFVPFDVLHFGEERILSSLEASPPDYVALVHRDTSTYGPKIFGHDYAPRIWAWVTANYEPERVFGAPPFRSVRFGILLLRRKELASGAGKIP